MDVDQPGPSSSTTLLQLPVNLFTRDGTHSIPQSTYLIPSTWRRFQLSELINKVLRTSSSPDATPVPFDFIVEGELLRGTLENWVKSRRGGDVESTINVEYVRSLMPPKQVGSFPQDDWVSGVSLGRPGYILLSSYLSHLKILPLTTMETSTTPVDLLTLPLPTPLGATTCTWLSPPSQSSDILLAAGSLDRLTHVFSIPSLDNPTAAEEGPTEILTLHGHTGPVSCTVPNKDFSQLLTTSWDGLLHLYSLPTASRPLQSFSTHNLPAEPSSYLPGQNSKKKRRLNAPEVVEGGWRKSPDVVMRGHVGRVGGAVWDKEDDARVWSAGWDGSVRGWDVGMGYQVELKQGPSDKAALCIDQFAQTYTLATGSMDRTISLWDTRSPTSLISLSLPCPSPIPSIRCHPTSQYTLASATYDGMLQIWDIRSPKQALFGVRREQKAGKGERVLCLDWDGERLIAGGEDGEVGVWTARGE